jgi:hypothetical protein
MSQINLKHLFCLKKTKDWNKNFFSFFRYKENHLFIFTHRVNIKKTTRWWNETKNIFSTKRLWCDMDNLKIVGVHLNKQICFKRLTWTQGSQFNEPRLSYSFTLFSSTICTIYHDRTFFKRCLGAVTLFTPSGGPWFIWSINIKISRVRTDLRSQAADSVWNSVLVADSVYGFSFFSCLYLMEIPKKDRI